MLDTDIPWRLRGLIIVIERLEREQALDKAEFEALYTRSDELLLRICERNERVRKFREIVLRGGKS